jgi:hypothetical protein
MPSYATLDNVDKILKEYTEGTGREELMSVQAPTLALFKKDTGYGGKVKPLPFEFAPIAGISPLFSAAQASKEDASEDAWQITTDDMFATWSLDHKAMWMTRNDKHAFIELVEARAKSAMTGFRKVIAHASYGNGGGMLAEIEANDGAGTLTLIPNGSMRIFDKGMYLQPSLTDGTSGSVINDIQQIATVNRHNRTITAVSGDFPIANYAVGSFVFLRGGFGRYIDGISAWVTDTTPSATLFNGVDRTQDSRLYGVSYTPTADDANAEEGLITLGERVHEQGGESDLLLCHPAFKTAVRKIIGNKVEYDKLSGTRSDGSEASISFRTIKLTLDSGDVDLLSDYNCPRDKVYLLQKDTWTWISAGEIPMRLKYGDDDKNYARHGTENAMEARLGAYFQLACTFPGANGVMQVPDEWLAALPE